MLRFGILSTAKIGREKLAPAIMNSKFARIEGIASRDLARAQAMQSDFAIPLAFGSYEDMLASDQIDAVYIPLITSEHVEWTIKAANAGKHVLCEKPMALQAGQIDSIIAAASVNSVVIAEAFMVYYHPQWAKVRELIETRAIGDLRHIAGAFTYQLLDASNMRNKPEQGGGGILDIGVYPTVTTRIVTQKEPVRVRADIEFDPQFGTDRYANITAQFEGFDLQFYVSTQMALRQNMVFHGSDGFIEVHAPFNAGNYGDARLSLWNSKHDYAQEFRFDNIDQYRLQIDAFAKAVKGEGDIFSLQNSRNNQKVIDGYFASNECKDWVKI